MKHLLTVLLLSISTIGIGASSALAFDVTTLDKITEQDEVYIQRGFDVNTGQCFMNAIAGRNEEPDYAKDWIVIIDEGDPDENIESSVTLAFRDMSVYERCTSKGVYVFNREEGNEEKFKKY